MQTLSIRGVSKAFEGAPALSDVSLDLLGGEVHALMGENGAGKSTLIKILAGVQSANHLEMTKDGRDLPHGSPQQAHDAGFRFIHQELNVVGHISVAENIFLGLPYPRRFGVAIDWSILRAKADQALARLGLRHIDTRQQAARLATGDQMLMKIAGALVSEDGRAGELYVLDEPTAALTGDECKMLFRVIAELKKAGAAILYVSHRMDEVMQIADQVTVLRDGKNVFSAKVDETNKEEIISAMTGRAVQDTYPHRTGKVADQVVCSMVQATTQRVSGIDFELRQGEILGVAGLANAGQSDVLEMMLGMSQLQSGSYIFEGISGPTNPSDAWDSNIAYVPKERRSQGLMLHMGVRENSVLPHLSELSHLGIFARKPKELTMALQAGKTVRLKSDGPEQPVFQLSGGNQQKVMFARALGLRPKLLLLDEPTRGVDVGAKFDIYSLVRGLSEQGCAVVLTSSDLPEMLGMCDRILIMCDHKQQEILPAAGMTAAQLLSRFYQTEAA